MAQVVCRWCGTTQTMDAAKGAVQPCTSCGNPIAVGPPQRKRCAGCGIDVSQQPRTKDKEGRYFCRTCVERLSARAFAGVSAPGMTELPDLSEMLPEEEGDDASGAGESGGDRQITCPKCYRNVTAYQTPASRAAGRIDCPFCRQAARERWARLARRWAPLASIAVVVIVGGFVGVRMIHNALDRKAAADAAAQARAIVPVEPATKPATVPVRTLPMLVNLARAAQQAGDYPTLFKLMAERERLLPDGAGPEVKQDRAVIEQARALVASVRYPEAAKVLSDRWQRRRNDRIAPYGQVGIELLKVCLAAMVVDDEWLRPPAAAPNESVRASLQSLAREVRAVDPMSLEATLIEAFLDRPASDEELLRLDLRASVLQRNRLLLPIRAGLEEICRPVGDVSSSNTPGGGGTGGLRGYDRMCRELTDINKFHEQFSASLANAGVPLDLVTAAQFSSMVELGTGESRQAVYGDYWRWHDLLDEPWHWLHGRGSSYQFIAGLMWELTETQNGLIWRLLVPPTTPNPSGRSRTKQWHAFSATLVRWTHDLENTPNADLQARLATIQPMTDRSPMINGMQLLFYPLRDVTPAEVAHGGVPMIQGDSKEIIDAFVASTGLPQRAERGTALLLPTDPTLTDDRIVTLQGFMQDGKFRVDLPKSPLFVLLQAAGDAQIEGIPPLPASDATRATTSGGAGAGATPAAPVPATEAPDTLRLLASTGQIFTIRADNHLETQTPGGGTVVLPVQGASVKEPALRDARLRMLRSMIAQSRLIDAVSLKGMIKEYGRQGTESAEDLMAGALFDGKMAIVPPGPSIATAYRMLVRSVRWRLLGFPHGIDPGNRSRIVCITDQHEPLNLQFIDEKASLVDAFYTRQQADDQLGKLSEHAVKDFFAPSFLAMPWPLTPQLTPGAASINDLGTYIPFWQARARDAAGRDDLHSASTFYRELTFPVFKIAEFDSRQPRNRDQMQELLGAMSTAMERAHQKLQSRLEHADVLRRAGRAPAADEMSTAILLETDIAALPFLDELRRYAAAYGYASPQAFETERFKISTLIQSMGPAASLAPPAPPRAGGKPFDAQSAAGLVSDTGQLDDYLEAFYDRGPDMASYCAAKQWLAQRVNVHLHRPPTTVLDRQMLAWSPVEWRENTIAPIDPAAVFTVTAAGRARRWRDLWYNVEVLHDARAARRLLLDWAHEELSQRNPDNPTAPQGVVGDFNRIACLWLAAAADQQLGFGFGACHLDPNLVEASRLELAIFVKPRLTAIGLSGADLSRLQTRIHLLIQNTTMFASGDAYAASRYFWTEYAQTLRPLLDEVHAMTGPTVHPLTGLKYERVERDTRPVYRYERRVASTP